jgi:hypothetical protein
MELNGWKSTNEFTSKNPLLTWMLKFIMKELEFGNGGTLPILNVPECLAPILTGNGGSLPIFSITECLAPIVTVNGGSLTVFSVTECSAPILTG